jgi:hypothetical protein
MGRAPAQDKIERARQVLFENTLEWAPSCAKIVNKQGVLVPLIPNDAQRRLDAALEAQRTAGLPMRVINLKARKLGASTWVQAKLMHRVTQQPYRRAMVVAHDKKTAGKLFDIGERIWANLPVGDAVDKAAFYPDPDGDAIVLPLKPHRIGFRRGVEMHFGEPSRNRRDQGDMGLDSLIEIDTANEVEAGRGDTPTELHLSEVAFWKDVRKMTALLNAIPDEPETIVVIESTANGTNHFKTMWDRAVAGESLYTPLFFAWHEDPTYRLPFNTEEERAEFVVGAGAFGEDEPMLVEKYGCDLEQLHWRRRTIVDKCDSKLETFDQEYPHSPEVAFQASGKHVFSMALVSAVLARCRETDPAVPDDERPGPEVGTFEADRTFARKTPSGMVDVPVDPKWKPAPRPRKRVSEGQWKLWEHPDPGKDGGPKGHYVVSVDPAEGAETTSGESAFMAVQVIDHRSKRQVAELRTRDDWDLVLLQAVMAAMYFNRAAISVEKTGGYGTSMIQRLKDIGYWPLYRQKVLDKATRESPTDRTGFNTDRATKPLLEDGIKYLLREMPEVFRSFLLAYELTTYVKDPKTGKTGPEPDAFSDLLMAFAMAQQVALEMPIPSDRGATSTTVRARVNPITKL